MKVLICARREAALAKAAHDVAQTTQSKVEIQPLDVTRVDQIETIPGIVREKLDRIDILVNNAGTGTYNPFSRCNRAELVGGLAINLFTQFRICPRIAQGGGRIVDVSGETIPELLMAAHR